MTAIYFVFGTGVAKFLAERWDWGTDPLKILVSFDPATFKCWKTYQAQDAYKPSRKMLDSGAFGAWQSGITIDIDALAEEIRTGPWDEAVGLDVIGDAEASVRNADYLKSVGASAMPVFHIGDPWEHLDYYCKGWPKVGLSCRFGEPVKESYHFYEQCFARAWPYRFHSFGWMAGKMLRAFPFESADSSSWIAAAKWGRIPGMPPNLKINNATAYQWLTEQIRQWLSLERELTAVWGKELTELCRKEPS